MNCEAIVHHPTEESADQLPCLIAVAKCTQINLSLQSCRCSQRLRQLKCDLEIKLSEARQTKLRQRPQ